MAAPSCIIALVKLSGNVLMFFTAVVLTLSHSSKSARIEEGVGRLRAEEIFGTRRANWQRSASTTTKKYVPSPCPNEMDMCEEAGDYPQNHIETKLKEMAGNAFQMELYSYSKNRGEMGRKQETCVSEPITTMPRKGQDVNGNWVFIVNKNGTFEQVVWIERCRSDNSLYDLKPDLELPGNSVVQCEEKRTEIILMALDPEDGSLSLRIFNVPTLCRRGFYLKT